MVLLGKLNHYLYKKKVLKLVGFSCTYELDGNPLVVH